MEEASYFEGSYDQFLSELLRGLCLLASATCGFGSLIEILKDKVPIHRGDHDPSTPWSYFSIKNSFHKKYHHYTHTQPNNPIFLKKNSFVKSLEKKPPKKVALFFRSQKRHVTIISKL
jgi:hypothetical protein